MRSTTATPKWGSWFRGISRERLHDGRPAQVQALVDGTDDNTANVLIGYAQAVVQGYSSDIQLDWLRNHGQARPACSRQR